MKTFGKLLRTAAIALGCFYATLSAWGLGNEILPPGIITPVGDVLVRLGVKITIRVASNAELRAYRYGGIVVRDGFYAPGDGGGATYVHSASACAFTKNGKPGDDGAQVTDGGSGCWLTDLSKPISVKVWGAKIDDTTDDLAAWQAATTAMGAAQGDIATLSNTSGVLLFPGNNGTCSKLSAMLLINRSSLVIKGTGPHTSCFDPQFATGNGVQFGDSSHYVLNVGIEDVSFRSDTVHRTAGNSLAVWNAYYFSASNIGCYDYFYSCIGVDQNIAGNDYNFDRVFTGGTSAVTTGAGVYGFTIGANTPAGTSSAPNDGPVEVRVTRSELGQLGYGGTAGAAFNVVAVGGLYTYAVNTDFIYQSVWAHPGTGQQVSGWSGVNDNWDTQTGSAINFDTSGGGKITSISLRDEWVATCGFSSSGYTGVPCVQFSGPTDTIASVSMEFAPLIAAGGNGLNIATGTDLRFSGHITANGLASAHTAAAIAFSPPSGVAIKDVQIDARLGGSIGADGALPPNLQSTGVYIAPPGGTITNLIGRGDWSGNFNAASGVSDNGSAADQATHDFGNVFPATWTVFTPTLSCASGSLSTSAQSATMRYRRVGKIVSYTVTLVAGTNGTCAGLKYSLPLAPIASTTISGRETVATGKAVTSSLRAASTTANTQFFDNSRTGANGTTYVISGQYEML